MECGHDQNITIMVPAPVIAEYLVGATDTQIQELEVLRRGFEIPSLDAPSSTRAAILQRGGIVNEIRAEYGTPRQSIKIDAFIIAIAIENHASRIITNNVREFKKLARGQILVDEVPVIQQQGDMFSSLRAEPDG